MKNLFRISLFIAVILIPQVSNSLTKAITEGTKRDIDLMGSFLDVSPRSPQLNPIHATISSINLEAEFLTHLGDIDVEVYTATGSLVYENNVNTQTQQTVLIGVSNWDSGVYEIRFVNLDGNYMYGTFEIKP